MTIIGSPDYQQARCVPCELDKEGLYPQEEQVAAKDPQVCALARGRPSVGRFTF